MSDRVLRFPDRIWDELEGLPQPLRNAAHRRSFTCSMNQSRRLPTHFPKQTRCQVLPSPSSVGRPDHLVHGHRESRRAGRHCCAVCQGRYMNMGPRQVQLSGGYGGRRAPRQHPDVTGIR